MKKKYENIPGWPGYYISRLGVLYSKKSGIWVKRRGGIYKGRLQYMMYRTVQKSPNQRHHQWGFSTVEKRWFKASRLVALAWVDNPKPEEYNTVCHIDNNPSNNFYKNLYWGTQSMNIRQAVDEGRFYQCKRIGKLNPMYGRKGSLHPSYGIPRSEITRLRISEANKGKTHSEETKAKISNTLKSKNRGKTVPLMNDIKKLRDQGWSQVKIANRLGIHQTAVSKAIKRLLTLN